jgi:GDPmannose 4,6-dehydratase
MIMRLRRGRVMSRALFIEIAFRLVGLDWREDVVSDKGLCRPTDLAVGRGNPSKAREKLGWVAKHKIADIVRLMIEARQDR